MKLDRFTFGWLTGICLDKFINANYKGAFFLLLATVAWCAFQWLMNRPPSQDPRDPSKF